MDFNPASYGASAGDWQRALTTNLQPLQGAVDQASALQRQQSEDAKDEKDKADLRAASRIKETQQDISLHTGTGSYADPMLNQKGAAMLSKTRDWVKQNPTGSETDFQNFIASDHNDLTNQYTAALQRNKDSNDYAASVLKENPWLDELKVHQALKNESYKTDDKGNISINPSANFRSAVNPDDPNSLASLANPNQVSALSSHLLASEQPSSSFVDNGTSPNPYDPSKPFKNRLIVTKRDYQDYDLPSNSWKTKLDPTQVGDQTIGILPQDQTGRFYNNPVLQVAANLRAQSLQKEQPDLWRSMTPDQQNRYAQGKVVDELGSKKGDKPVEDKAYLAEQEKNYQIQNQLKHQNFQERMEGAKLSIERQRLNMAQNKKQSDSDLIYNVYNAAAKGDPAAQKKLSSNIQYTDLGFGQPVANIPFSQMAGQQLYEPGTKNPVQVNQIVDPRYGKAVYVQRMVPQYVPSPNDNNKLVRSGRMIPDESDGSIKVYSADPKALKLSGKFEGVKENPSIALGRYLKQTQKDKIQELPIPESSAPTEE